MRQRGLLGAARPHILRRIRGRPFRDILGKDQALFLAAQQDRGAVAALQDGVIHRQARHGIAGHQGKAAPHQHALRGGRKARGLQHLVPGAQFRRAVQPRSTECHRFRMPHLHVPPASFMSRAPCPGPRASAMVPKALRERINSVQNRYRTAG